MTKQEFDEIVKAENLNTINLIERSPGYDLGMHQHPFDAFALITAGTITLVVEGVAATYGVGDTFRLPINTPHLESTPTGVIYLAARRDASTS